MANAGTLLRESHFPIISGGLTIIILTLPVDYATFPYVVSLSLRRAVLYYGYVGYRPYQLVKDTT